MGNRVNIEATKFTNKDGSETYGFRMYDDYAQMYNNCADSNIMYMDDLDLFDYAIERSDDISGEMFSFCHEENKGMCINDAWYDYDDLKEHFIKQYGG